MNPDEYNIVEQEDMPVDDLYLNRIRPVVKVATMIGVPFVVGTAVESFRHRAGLQNKWYGRLAWAAGRTAIGIYVSKKAHDGFMKIADETAIALNEIYLASTTPSEETNG